MIVYFDGSEVPAGAKKGGTYPDRIYSWGIVVHHGDATHEYAGACQKGAKNRSEHEVIAFIEAVLKVEALGGNPLLASYHTDDMFAAYAHLDLHPLNYRPMARQRALSRIRSVCSEFYSSREYQLAAEVLEKGRFTKVKGHHTTVYNLRADYLSRCAHQTFMGAQEEAKPFEQWLADGFTCYNRKKELVIWHAPFAIAEHKRGNRQAPAQGGGKYAEKYAGEALP